MKRAKAHVGHETPVETDEGQRKWSVQQQDVGEQGNQFQRTRQEQKKNAETLADVDLCSKAQRQQQRPR